MIHIKKNVISKEDVSMMLEYASTADFHTKAGHVPLHDQLFDGGAPFDIRTRGEIPKNLLDIFSKYSKAIWEFVSEIEDVPYNPPMFSKYYIARYRKGFADNGFHFADNRPKGTYGSYVFWNKVENGGNLESKNFGRIEIEPGDLVFFTETEDNAHMITRVDSDDPLFITEAWLAPVGVCPDPNTTYAKWDWDNYEIRGF